MSDKIENVDPILLLLYDSVRRIYRNIGQVRVGHKYGLINLDTSEEITEIKYDAIQRSKPYVKLIRQENVVYDGDLDIFSLTNNNIYHFSGSSVFRHISDKFILVRNNSHNVILFRNDLGIPFTSGDLNEFNINTQSANAILAYYAFDNRCGRPKYYIVTPDYRIITAKEYVKQEYARCEVIGESFGHMTYTVWNKDGFTNKIGENGIPLLKMWTKETSRSGDDKHENKFDCTIKY